MAILWPAPGETCLSCAPDPFSMALVGGPCHLGELGAISEASISKHSVGQLGKSLSPSATSGTMDCMWKTGLGVQGQGLSLGTALVPIASPFWSWLLGLWLLIKHRSQVLGGPGLEVMHWISRGKDNSWPWDRIELAHTYTAVPHTPLPALLSDLGETFCLEALARLCGQVAR